MVRRPDVHPVRVPRLGSPLDGALLLRIPRCPEFNPVNPYFLTFRGFQGGSPPLVRNFPRMFAGPGGGTSSSDETSAGRRTSRPDHARTTGPALDAHFPPSTTPFSRWTSAAGSPASGGGSASRSFAADGFIWCENLTTSHPRFARGLLEQRTEEPPVREPQQEHHRKPEQQRRIPCCPHARMPEPAALRGRRARDERPGVVMMRTGRSSLLPRSAGEGRPSTR